MLYEYFSKRIKPIQYLILIFSILVHSYAFSQSDIDKKPHPDFEYIHHIIPDVIYDIRYATQHNFTGKPVPGYHAEVALMTKKALKHLKAAADELREEGYLLLIYDAYRPQKAVDSFVEWAKNPADTIAKSIFYPELSKNQLFPLGYIASRSGHTRGSTIDLSLIHQKTQLPLDMGSPHDFFGEISHHTTQAITKDQKANREILRNAMVRNGFKSYSKEWWHYTLRTEPFPDTYFNFDVE